MLPNLFCPMTGCTEEYQCFLDLIKCFMRGSSLIIYTSQIDCIKDQRVMESVNIVPLINTLIRII